MPLYTDTEATQDGKDQTKNQRSTLVTFIVAIVVIAMGCLMFLPR